MKACDIIGNYCRFFRVPMPKIEYSETRYFVAICPEGARVLYMHQASKILGRVVCEAMKRGTVLYVNNGWVTPLTWEKWQKTWTRLFAPKERKSKIPEPNRLRPYKSEIFEVMQQERPPKKPQKHGFERTFIANKSMNQLGHPLAGVRAERIKS